MKINYSRLKYVVSAWLLSMQLSAYAVNHAAPDFTQAADQLFSAANSPDKPALAVALLQDGKVVYEKAYGSVNLEYRVAATAETRFQVDALAWEFVAFAAMLLEEQGKIKLNDDIRTYLPDMPDFGARITIAHLLQSTDGLHGYKALQALAGWEIKELGQQQAIAQLIKNQKKLKFKPGSEFSPGGDTRLILLAKIVEAASGQAFDAYCQTHIFKPLGMHHTLFVYDNSIVLENMAVAYRDDGKGAYQHAHGSGHAAGPVNLYTSIRDLALWRSERSSHKVFKKSLTDKLAMPIRLDNGKIIKNISSISIFGQQHAGKERGLAKIYQTGNSGGYASSIFHFPEHNITTITLSSGLAYNGSYGMRLASILLEHHFPEPEKIDYKKIVPVKLTAGQLQKYVGNYWSPAWTLAAKIYVKNNALYYTRIGAPVARELIHLGDSVFQMVIEGDDQYHLKFVDNGDAKEIHFSMTGSDPVIFEPYVQAAYSEHDLAQFSGLFYSKEINSTFVFKVSQGMLVANNMRTGSVNFKPLTADLFSGDKNFMGGIKFNRGKNNEITGFHVMTSDARYLAFTKMQSAQAQKMPL